MIAGSVLRDFQRGKESVRPARSFVVRGKRRRQAPRKTKASAKARLTNDESCWIPISLQIKNNLGFQIFFVQN
jgi:hypothetical protein